MLCPRCKKVLRVRLIEEVEIDKCLECGGAWFDQDELRVAKDSVEPDLRWMDFEIWQDEDQFQISEGALTCPKCLIPMAAVNYGDTVIEVDYCARCQGTWLDGGEFEKIIEALNTEMATKSVSDYVEASLQEAREVIDGPESRPSEWRDLTTVMRLFQYRTLIENPRLRDLVEAIQRGSRNL